MSPRIICIYAEIFLITQRVVAIFKYLFIRYDMDYQEVERNQILIDFIKENYLKKIEKLDDVKGFIRGDYTI